MSTSPWTDELRAEVCELWKEMSAGEIAGALNLRGYPVTRNAIVGLLHRAGKTVDHKSSVHPLTRDNGQRRPRVPKHEQKGAPTGSLAYKVISGIKQKQNAKPGIDPEPFVCAEAADIIPRNLSMMELESGDCRYGYGDGPFLFCGHPRQPGSSYCASHHAICWVKAKPPAEKRAPWIELGKSSGGVFRRAV